MKQLIFSKDASLQPKMLSKTELHHRSTAPMDAHDGEIYTCS